MRQIDPATIPVGEVHRYLLSCVAPRPIAFVTTRSADGIVNLSPFSFFNAFGANPPVVAFSPAFRGSDGSSKHTYENILETGEFTISTVSYSMVEQMSLSSADWPREVDEFDVTGLTPTPSTVVSPPGVAESPMFMECTLMHHLSLGDGPASGNLLVGEVKMFHIKDSLFVGKYPDVDRLDLVARMGGPQYCRASGDAVFSLAKPSGLGVGYQALPEAVKQSDVLTANDTGILASHSVLPSESEVEQFLAAESEIVVDDESMILREGTVEELISLLISGLKGVRSWSTEQTHRVVHQLLGKRRVEEAWLVLAAAER